MTVVTTDAGAFNRDFTEVEAAFVKSGGRMISFFRLMGMDIHTLTHLRNFMTSTSMQRTEYETLTDMAESMSQIVSIQLSLIKPHPVFFNDLFMHHPSGRFMYEHYQVYARTVDYLLHVDPDAGFLRMSPTALYESNSLRDLFLKSALTPSEVRQIELWAIQVHEWLVGRHLTLGLRGYFEFIHQLDNQSVWRISTRHEIFRGVLNTMRSAAELIGHPSGDTGLSVPEEEHVAFRGLNEQVLISALKLELIFNPTFIAIKESLSATEPTDVIELPF